MSLSRLRLLLIVLFSYVTGLIPGTAALATPVPGETETHHQATQTMSQHNRLIIDDRSTKDLQASSGVSWRLVTDGVMGGVSRGQLDVTQIEQRACLRMQGKVRLENNGGFIQMSLPFPDNLLSDISSYTGIMLEVYGNGQDYNLHLRTRDISLPWQSYRAGFTAGPKWQNLYLPFSDFEAYRIDAPLDITRLTRLGLVAIGREFNADLCLARITLYR